MQFLAKYRAELAFLLRISSVFVAGGDCEAPKYQFLPVALEPQVTSSQPPGLTAANSLRQQSLYHGPSHIQRQTEPDRGFQNVVAAFQPAPNLQMSLTNSPCSTDFQLLYSCTRSGVRRQ